jgi:FkbM family methyltransferase
MAKAPNPRAFDMTLVEGSPLVYRELRSRVEREPFLKDRAVTVHGLVGERAGSAKIFESASLGANNSLFATRIPQGVDVPYVDLTGVIDERATIDLLKCDIEGSELSILENYRDLLPRARVAVFEFHPDVRDVDRCLEILGEAGFRNREDLRGVEFFWK